MSERPTCTSATRLRTSENADERALRRRLSASAASPATPASSEPAPSPVGCAPAKPAREASEPADVTTAVPGRGGYAPAPSRHTSGQRCRYPPAQRDTAAQRQAASQRAAESADAAVADVGGQR